ncbi:unnamed protein product [Closterium sp. Naga37s-1]|nr:unnamed protein product [Closterium sp. Naga37s-1]
MVSESGAPPGRAMDMRPAEGVGQGGERVEQAQEQEEAPQTEPVTLAAPRMVAAEEPVEAGVAVLGEVVPGEEAEALAADGTAAASGDGSASPAAMDAGAPPQAEEQELAGEQGRTADTMAAATPIPVAATAAASAERQAPPPVTTGTAAAATGTTPGDLEQAEEATTTVGPPAAEVQHEDQRVAGALAAAACAKTPAAAKDGETQEHAQGHRGGSEQRWRLVARDPSWARFCKRSRHKSKSGHRHLR